MDTIFDKYDKRGAYHWQTTRRLGLRFNAPLVSRYSSVIRRIPVQARFILDFGSGDGYLSCLLATRFPSARVTGLEYEASGVAIARQAASERHVANVEFMQSRSERLPFEDDVFDVVVMADVIEHLPHVDQILAELNRVLVPGGRLIVTTPNRQAGSTWDPRHVFEFKASELEGKLSELFQDVVVAGSWPMEDVKAWKAKRLRRVLLDLAARLGSNAFDREVESGSDACGQLTASATKREAPASHRTASGLSRQPFAAEGA